MKTDASVKVLAVVAKPVQQDSQSSNPKPERGNKRSTFNNECPKSCTRGHRSELSRLGTASSNLPGATKTTKRGLA